MVSSCTDIAKQTGLNAYYLKKKYIPQAAQFQISQLETALRKCVEAEEDVKTGRMQDIQYKYLLKYISAVVPFLSPSAMKTADFLLEYAFRFMFICNRSSGACCVIYDF